MQHLELEAKVKAQEQMIAQQSYVSEQQSFMEIAKKVHKPPAESINTHDLPQGSQGMDREQVRLYKKKQRDQARMISDLELQKEATAEEERLNIRTQSIERIVQRERSQDRLSRTPRSQNSPISMSEPNEKIDETADF